MKVIGLVKYDKKEAGRIVMHSNCSNVANIDLWIDEKNTLEEIAKKLEPIATPENGLMVYVGRNDTDVPPYNIHLHGISFGGKKEFSDPKSPFIDIKRAKYFENKLKEALPKIDFYRLEQWHV